MHRTLDPVALLAEMRAAQTELGERIDRRPGKIASAAAGPITGTGCSDLCEDARQVCRGGRAARDAPAAEAALQEAGAHAVDARPARRHDRGLACCGAAADRARHRRPIEREAPEQFCKKQHSIVQRLLKALRRRPRKGLWPRWRRACAAPLSSCPGLWTALRVMGTPPRPQPLPSVTSADEAIRDPNSLGLIASTINFFSYFTILANTLAAFAMV